MDGRHKKKYFMQFKRNTKEMNSLKENFHKLHSRKSVCVF